MCKTNTGDRCWCIANVMYYMCAKQCRPQLSYYRLLQLTTSVCLHHEETIINVNNQIIQYAENTDCVFFNWFGLLIKHEWKTGSGVCFLPLVIIVCLFLIMFSLFVLTFLILQLSVCKTVQKEHTDISTAPPSVIAHRNPLSLQQHAVFTDLFMYAFRMVCIYSRIIMTVLTQYST